MTHIIAPAVGVTIELDCKVDLTGNTGLSMYIEQVGGVGVTKNATISATNSQKMEYVIQVGDFDPNNAAILGDYIIVAAASFSGASPIYSDPYGFKVIKKGQRP